MGAIDFFKINEVLSNWASNSPPIINFTVENILYASNIDNDYYEEVFRYLMSKNGFELIPKKIVLCPNNHKGETFRFEEPVEEEEFDCICGEENFIPDFLIVFDFTDQFISQCKKKRNTQNMKCSMLV